MDFLQRNLFVKLRSDHFHTKEEMEPMTTFKQKKMVQLTLISMYIFNTVSTFLLFQWLFKKPSSKLAQ